MAMAYKLTRIISTAEHDLSAPQVLESLLRLFKDDRIAPVYISGKSGKVAAKIKQVRVELSRLRKRAELENVPFPAFGFVSSQLEIKTKVCGLTLEYYQVDFRVSRKQQYKRIFSKSEELQL